MTAVTEYYDAQLRVGRTPPILPATIHDVPRRTVEKLATALYWIGRTAIRGQTESCEKARARLALIEQAAEEALS